MSTQTPAKDTSRRELEADFLFNQHLFRTLAYTGAGFGFGLLTSLLFKHKAGMTVFFAGTGAGYGASGFVNDLSHFIRFKNMSQSQGQDKIANKARDLKDGARDMARDLKEGAKDKTRDLRQGAKDLKEGAKDKVRDLKEGARDMTSNLREGAKDLKEGAKDKAKDLKENAKDAAANLQQKASTIQHRSDTQDQHKQMNRDHQRQESHQKQDNKSGTTSAQKDDKDRLDRKNGQTFQNFETTSGKHKEGANFAVKTDYQENRNRTTDQDAINKRRQVQGLEQDRMFDTIGAGNTHRLEEQSDTKQGAQNYSNKAPTNLKKPS